MAKKRIPINDKRRPTAEDIDELFPNNYVNNPPEKVTSTEIKDEPKEEPKEKKLRNINEIKAFYDDYVGGKQVSIYLPEELHAIVKAKASKDNSSMKNVIKHLVIYNLLTDEEVREAYNKRFE